MNQRKAIFLVGLGLVSILSGLALRPVAADALSAANQAYRRGDFEAAVQHYKAAAGDGVDPSALAFGQAAALYRLQHYSEAETRYEQSQSNVAPYNRGNCDMQLAVHASTDPDAKRLHQAADLYRMSVEHTSANIEDGRHNLEVAKLFLAERPETRPDPESKGGKEIVASAAGENAHPEEQGDQARPTNSQPKPADEADSRGAETKGRSSTEKVAEKPSVSETLQARQESKQEKTREKDRTQSPTADKDLKKGDTADKDAHCPVGPPGKSAAPDDQKRPPKGDGGNGADGSAGIKEQETGNQGAKKPGNKTGETGTPSTRPDGNPAEKDDPSMPSSSGKTDKALRPGSGPGTVDKPQERDGQSKQPARSGSKNSLKGKDAGESRQSPPDADASEAPSADGKTPSAQGSSRQSPTIQRGVSDAGSPFDNASDDPETAKKQSLERAAAERLQREIQRIQANRDKGRPLIQPKEDVTSKRKRDW